MSEIKKCKHCQSEIDKKAKVCPNCRKKQGGRLKFIIIGVVVFFIVVGALNNDDNTLKEVNTEISDDAKNKDAEKPEEKENPIEYTAYEVSELLNDLDSNAMKAEKKYNKQYVEITGILSNIDSSGKYISLDPDDEGFTFINVQCYMKTDEQKDKVMEMNKGDKVTLKGKIKSVGEVLGYSLDIDEIK